MAKARLDVSKIAFIWYVPMGLRLVTRTTFPRVAIPHLVGKDATVVGLHVVAGYGVGPCAATSARLIEWPDAALSFENARVLEFLKYFSVSVYVH
jgi:hypothetical protein